MTIVNKNEDRSPLRGAPSSSTTFALVEGEDGSLIHVSSWGHRNFVNQVCAVKVRSYPNGEPADPFRSGSRITQIVKYQP